MPKRLTLLDDAPADKNRLRYLAVDPRQTAISTQRGAAAKASA